MSDVKSNICWEPWVGLNVSQQGQFKPCCRYDHPIADNFLDYENSLELADLKQEFLKGNRPSACYRCWNSEDAGGVSRRQQVWRDVFKNTKPQLDELKILMFSFGNSCNLACRTCSSYQSSSWIKEEKKLSKIFPELKIHGHQRFYQDPRFLDQLKDRCKNLQQAHFIGGEPFIAGIDEHLDFLDHLLANNPQNITLYYTTNCTVFPQQEFWDRWTKFQRIELSLSIDGIGNQFGYTRWPAVWDETLEILKKYRAVKVDNIDLTISHVISVFTVYYYPEFTKWCVQNKFSLPISNLLDRPKHYNIKILPKAVKDKIAEKLGRFNFKEIVYYMYSEDLSEEFDTTIKYIHAVDQQRNQIFAETYPEFYNILKDAGCQI